MKRSSFSFIVPFVIALFCIADVDAQPSKKMNSQLEIVHINRDFSITALEDPNWKRGKEVAVKTYWSGENAPKGRQFKARLVWSDTALYIRFEADQDEPLVVSEKPDLSKKIRGLWDRDVCEIFIVPDKNETNKYFEFEIAPNGEWIDLGIEVTPEIRLTDWDYSSGMRSAAAIGKGKVTMAIKIEFSALGRTPKAGDIWLGNLFRCVGKDPTRGYLSWQPTNTKEPSFHVPSKFGEFKFTK